MRKFYKRNQIVVYLSWCDEINSVKFE